MQRARGYLRAERRVSVQLALSPEAPSLAILSMLEEFLVNLCLLASNGQQNSNLTESTSLFMLLKSCLYPKGSIELWASGPMSPRPMGLLQGGGNFGTRGSGCTEELSQHLHLGRGGRQRSAFILKNRQPASCPGPE